MFLSLTTFFAFYRTIPTGGKYLKKTFTPYCKVDGHTLVAHCALTYIVVTSFSKSCIYVRHPDMVHGWDKDAKL